MPPSGLFSSPKVSAVVPIAVASKVRAAPPVRSARSNLSVPCAGSTSEAIRTTNTSKRSLGPSQLKIKRLQPPLLPRQGPSVGPGVERGKLDIWMLGLTIVIGGQYFSWNAGLSAGFFSYLVAIVLVAAAYISLCCCTAEIAGALPFAGGAYGLSRCTLGFFPGFMIGCCEALEYIAYVSTTVTFLADLIVSSVSALAGLEPLIWLAFYMSALAIQLQGGRVFWSFNLVIGAASLFIVLIFVFGALSFLDFEKLDANADANVGFVGGFRGFLRVLPIATWFFVGVEALPMASDDVHQPKAIVPKAQVMCVLTLAVTGLMVYFVTVSLPAGEGVEDHGLATLAASLAPLNPGFELMFKISSSAATMLSLPATYATAFGFIWCYGKLIHAMSTSRLLPSVLSRTTESNGVPYVALLVGSALSYALCVVVYCVPQVTAHLFPVCITSAFVAYTGQCIGYISLKKNYRNIKSSHFTNPFGIAGAVFSMCVWLLGLVSIAGFQDDGHVEIVAFLTVVLVVALVYYGYAKERQTFSPQENKVLLVAHVTKFNANRFSGKSKHKSKAISRGTTNNNNPSSHVQGGGGSKGGSPVAEAATAHGQVRPSERNGRA